MSVRESHALAAADLRARATALLAAGYRVAAVAAHDDGDALRVVYLFVAGEPDRRVELVVRLDPDDPRVPTLADVSFPAGRFEREMHDAFGVVPEGHPFLRPLVRHAQWPATWHPMRRGAPAAPSPLDGGASFPFVEVQGGGVYEIPVGPIHAGLIEPGHFRFSVVGETIVKMTARLWYVHRGVERLFEGTSAVAGVPLAERVAGDSALAHGLAYAMAVEDALGWEVEDEDRIRRALVLELERLYNHVGDVGALCNDVGYGVAHARAMVLRESLLRLNEAVTGHRLLRGAVAPGGAALMRLPSREELDATARSFEELEGFIVRHSVVMDRFEGTAVLQRGDADAMGVLGVVARASGRPTDARLEHPFTPSAIEFRRIEHAGGDVLARFRQRVEEVRDSLSILEQCRVALAGAGPREALARRVEHGGSGVGIVEGWRGTLVHRVEVDDAGVVTRVRVVDPSFFNWPALAVSLADTIVPDFPLVNKSFNLSYAGNDL